MRREPIVVPAGAGCGTCGSVPSILDSRMKFHSGCVHFLNLTIDDKYVDITGNDITIEDIELKYKDKLKDCSFAELHHITPLHEETWELNLEDRKWYLVDQGEGYA